MKKKFYIKINKVLEIPVENLRLTSNNGRQYELQSKLWNKMHNFILKRNLDAAQDCIN